MHRVIFLFILSALLVPGRANALTLRDLIELSRAGLGDEVLLALIDVDQPVFSIDAATLKSLKAAGVSERVIVAVVRSGRPPAPAVAQAPAPEPVPVVPVAPEPQVIVIDHHDAQPLVREVAVPYLVYIPVVQRPRARDEQARDDRARDGERGRIGAATAKPAEPVYWGWGGKRRPDAWKEK